MTAVLLALGGALCYGVSDFIGGVASRRTSAWPVATAACTGALLGTVALAVFLPGDPRRIDYLWALAAGVGSGLGTAFLYRGFARGRMSVVAPVSGVGAVAVPVLAGLLVGERPALLAWVGIGLAAPAIWLVSQVDDDSADARATSGLADGLVAGLGFGGIFACVGQIPDSAGLWPIAVNQAVSVLMVVLAASLMGGRPLPRIDERAGFGAGLIGGLMAALAVLGFLLATSQGMLSISAVLVSLYPAFTVVLALLVLHEPLHRAQAIGLALCAAAVVCVSLA